MFKKSLLVASVLVLVGNGCVSIDKVPQDQNSPIIPQQSSSSETLPQGQPVTSTEATPSSTTPESPTTTPDVKETDKTSTTTVMIKNFSFTPDKLVVKKGAKVTFKNEDGVEHTVTADNKAFDSGLLEKNQEFPLDTSTMVAGTYTYHCKPHPTMKGTLIVIE